MDRTKQQKPWQSFRLRLIAWYSLLAGISIVAADGFMYFEIRQSLLEQVDNALQVTAIQALKNINDEVDVLKFDPRQDTLVLASLLNEAGVEIYLLGQDGLVKEHFGDALTLPAGKSLEPGFETFTTENG